jgi:hypothetical protein
LAELADRLLEPLRSLQDARLLELTKAKHKKLEEHWEKLQALQATTEDCGSESPRSRIQKLLASLRPIKLVEDPAPGQLMRATEASVDRSVLAVYHTDALNRLLDAAKTEGAIDLRLLRCGWEGRTLSDLCLQSKWAEAIVQPAVSSLIIADRAAVARLFGEGDANVEEFAAQLICVAPVETSSQSPVDAQKDLDQWAGFAARWLDRRDAREEFALEFNQEAGRQLSESLRQAMSRRRWSSKREQRLAKNAVSNAAKIAMNFEVLSDQGLQPVSGDDMAATLKLAAQSSRNMTDLAAVLAQERQEEVLERTAERMHEFLCEMGETERWPLFKRFDHHPKELMDRALGRLIRTGRARQRPNGVVVAIEGGPEGQGSQGAPLQEESPTK